MVFKDKNGSKTEFHRNGILVIHEVQVNLNFTVAHIYIYIYR